MAIDLGNKSRGLHIVQVSYDEGVFFGDQDDEPVRRQIEYGRQLKRQRPGSRLSLVVLTNNRSVRRFSIENVAFVPAYGGKFLGRVRIYSCLVDLHKEQPIDVITTQSVFDDAWLAIFFAKMHGVRVVGQIHYDLFLPLSPPRYGKGLTGKIRFAVGVKFLRGFFALRVVGDRIKKQLLDNHLHHNVHVIPVPVSMLLDTARSLKPRKKTPRVIFVGRLDAEKNLEEWLRVAALVAAKEEKVEFDIVGNGPLRRRLEMRAKELGIESHVNFHGFLHYNKLGSIYRASRVFLLTSHYEGSPRVLVESYAHRVPAVAPHITGVEDIIVSGRTGFLLPSGDVQGMARSVLLLLHDENLARKMGTLGEKRVRELFDPTVLTERWVSLMVGAARPALPQIMPLRRRTWKR